MSGETSAPTPNEIALAGWLVGSFNTDPATENPETLQEWQVPFYDVALGALRNLAQVGPGEPLPQDWMPEPVQGAELYRTLSYERKVHGMIDSLQSYIADYKSGVLDTMLRDHQKDIMDVLSNAFAKYGTSKQINIESPTGTGKTAILTTLVEALKYKEQPNNKVRALVLVPTKSILGQTVDAFKKFTTIEAGMYFGESQEVKDVTAMTYQSFEKAVKRGDITRDMIDVIIRDESDEFAKGTKAGDAIEAFCFDPVTKRNKLVVGLTATTREGEEVAYKRSALESISDGLLAPISTRSVKTKAVVHEDKDEQWREDFTAEEVQHLMDDQERNDLIIKEVLSGLGGGRRVLVRCVPGREMAHPEMLKKRLNNMTARIVHPYAGDVQVRKIKAVIITGDVPMRQRQLLTKIYNNPLNEDMDVILFIDTLVRGFDTQVGKKIINAAPTRSLTIARQLLGRVLRPYQVMNGNWMAAEAVDIEDTMDNARQVLFADVINREAAAGTRYKPGAIIGPELRDLRYPNSAPGSAFEKISAEELAAIANQLAMRDLVTKYEELSENHPRTERRVGAAALIGQARVITERQSQSATRMSLRNIADILGCTQEEVLAEAEVLRIKAEVLPDPERGPEYFMSVKNFERLRDRMS